MAFLGPLLFGLAVAADGASGVRVSVSGQGLAVVARAATVSAVLEEIGRQSGTSVTYDEDAPSARMTCDFVAANPEEAFRLALEGLGVNYVLYGGTPDVPRVLFVAASTAARAPIAVAPTAAASRPAEADVADGEPGANSTAEPAAPAMSPNRFRHPPQAAEGDGAHPADAPAAGPNQYPGAAPGHSGVNPEVTGRSRDTHRQRQ